MGIFKKVKDAKATGAFKYFDPDFDGVVLITGIKADETRQNKPYVATTCKVIVSNQESTPPGAERSWYIDMTLDAAPGNIKQFAIEATGVSEEDFDAMSAEEVEEACDALVGEEQPCANLLLGLRTQLNKKGTYTIHTWSRLPDEKVKQVAAKARELEILTGPLCEMQAHVEKELAKKGKAA